MSYSTQQIRNVALAGHSGAGKTTLFEALLFAGGAIPAAGSLERGSTVSDFDPMEKARGHSLNTAIASTDHAGIHVNLVDTPGYPDFRGPTLSAFSAVETVAVVVNAATGVEYGTRRMMDYARARNLCRVLVVNKMDVDPGHLPVLLEELREAFGPECLPINLPADKDLLSAKISRSRRSFAGDVAVAVERTVGIGRLGRRRIGALGARHLVDEGDGRLGDHQCHTHGDPKADDQLGGQQQRVVGSERFRDFHACGSFRLDVQASAGRVTVAA